MGLKLDLSVYEKSVIVRALIDYKRKIWDYAELSEEDKELLRELYRDVNRILKKIM